MASGISRKAGVATATSSGRERMDITTELPVAAPPCAHTGTQLAERKTLPISDPGRVRWKITLDLSVALGKMEAPTRVRP